MNKITIPRLELIGATLGTRLAQLAINTLSLPNCVVYYWTDSSVVLTWIKVEGNWSVFVSNRVKEIRSLSSSSNWRHVPGNMNPADLPSRGTSPKGMVESCWWEGPAWLRQEEIHWPNVSISTDMGKVEEERRKIVNTSLMQSEPFLHRLRYFSVYTKIVRTICWILRMKYKPVQLPVKEITYCEFEFAEMTLIKVIQENYLEKIINKNIQTFKDKNGIIRLDTKLGLGSESTNFKYPIVLPGEEPIVQCMVGQRHRIINHAGVQTLMCDLREKFWIVGLRRLCRKIVNSCVKCKRFKAKPCSPPTGSLPKGRMEASSAFEFTGVDLAGPLTLKSGSKAWIVLFTCATYRAVHLEAVESLSTAEFVMALRRFIARRGRVSCISSDNATNFRGLSNALNNLNWDEIFCFSTIAKIRWMFLPPSAPWWGGFYERLIGVVKQTLRRILGRASVYLTELNTVLCDCEATINSRPLTYVSNSVDEMQPLSPSMFIQPLLQHDVADLDEIDAKSLNARDKYCRALRDGFRDRFRREYIGCLIQPRKQTDRYELQVGDLVLLELEDRRRVNWPIGKVTQLIPGSDGTKRVANVQTSTGNKIRPVQRLYPLEIRTKDSLHFETD